MAVGVARGLPDAVAVFVAGFVVVAVVRLVVAGAVVRLAVVVRAVGCLDVVLAALAALGAAGVDRLGVVAADGVPAVVAAGVSAGADPAGAGTPLGGLVSAGTSSRASANPTPTSASRITADASVRHRRSPAAGSSTAGSASCFMTVTTLDRPPTLSRDR